MSEPQTSSPPPRRRRWWRRLLWTAAVMVALLLALYLLRGPLLARPLGAVVADRLGQALGGDFAVGAVRGNWFGDLVIEDLRTLEEPGDGALRRLAADRIALEYGLWDLFTAPLLTKLDAVHAEGLELVIDRGAPGPEEDAGGDVLQSILRLLEGVEQEHLPALELDGRFELRPGLGIAAASGFALSGAAGSYRLELSESVLREAELPPLALALELSPGPAHVLELALELGGLGLRAEASLGADAGWSAEAALTGLGAPLQMAARLDGWTATSTRLDLAQVPEWLIAGIAGIGLHRERLPSGGTLELDASGALDGDRIGLLLAGHHIQIMQRDLDHLTLAADWDGERLRLDHLTATGLGSGLAIDSLSLGPEAPYLVALERAALRSEDLAVVAGLFGLQLPPALVPPDGAEVSLSARRGEGDHLLAEATLIGGGLRAQLEGSLGAELFSHQWRAAALELSVAAQLEGEISARVEGKLGGTIGDPSGRIALDAGGLRYRKLLIEDLELEAAVAGDHLRIEHLVAGGPRFEASVTGGVELDTGRVRDLEAEIAVLDFSAVNAVLATPVPVSGGGRVALRFSGQAWPLGEIIRTGEGSLELGVAGLGYAEHELPEFALALDFEPGATLVESLAVTLPSGLALALAEPFALRLDDGGWSVDELELVGDGTRIAGGATGRGWSLEAARLAIEDMPLATLATLPLELPELGGRWSGALVVDRVTGIPSFRLDLDTEELTVDGVAADIRARIVQDTDTTAIDSLRLEAAGGLRLDLEGAVPWWVSLGGLARRDAQQPQLAGEATLPLDHPLVAPLVARWFPEANAGLLELVLRLGSAADGLEFAGSLSAQELVIGEDRFDGSLRFHQDADGMALEGIDFEGSRQLELGGELRLPLRLEVDGLRWLRGHPEGEIDARLPLDHPLLVGVFERGLGVPVGGLLRAELRAQAVDDHLGLTAHVASQELTLAGHPVGLGFEARQGAAGIQLERLHLDGGPGVELRATGRSPLRWTLDGLVAAAGSLRFDLAAELALDAPLLAALGWELGSGRIDLALGLGRDEEGDALDAELQLEDIRPDLPLASEALALLPALEGGFDAHADAGGWRLAGSLAGPAALRLALAGDTALDLDRPQQWLTALWRDELRGTWAFDLPSLAWIAPLVPVITTTAGRIEASGVIAGSPGEPRLRGEGRIDGVLVQTRTGFPTVAEGAGAFRLESDAVVIDRLALQLGYEPAEITGRIPFDPRAAPIELTATGDNLLLYRDLTTSVRADLDIALRGPLADLTLSGAAGVTDLGYVRDFGLFLGSGGDGGIDTPQVELGLFSLPGPLAAMRFDLDVRDGPLGRRRQRDAAIRIRTNLLRADLGADLHLGGSGAEPRPTGRIFTTAGKVFMPFGVYVIRGGELIYPPEQPTNPRIEARATTRIQDYDVTVLVSGTMLDPRLEVTTSPYLDSRDAVLLATTGMLPSDIGASGMAMGVAATYLGRELLNSVFTGDDEGGGFFSEMQLEVATDEFEGGIARARLEIPLDPPFYTWAEYERTDWYEAYNGGFGYRVTPGRAPEPEIDREDPPPPGRRRSAPPWEVVAPPDIDRSRLLAAASQSYQDFVRNDFPLAAAHDGAFAMVVDLRRQGYATAEVTFEVDQGDPPVVTFRVEPGQRYVLADVRLIDADDYAVIDTLLEEPEKLAQILVGVDERYFEKIQVPDDEAYSEAKLDELAAAVGRLYRFAGYRQVETGPVLTSFDRDRGLVFADILVASGPRFTIDRVQVQGLEGLGAAVRKEIQELADVLRGSAYLERGLVLTQAMMREALADAGHLDAGVTYAVATDPAGPVAVTYRLEPGPIHVLRDIRVHWADTPEDRRRTGERYVSYKFTVDKGEVLSQRVIEQGVRYLLGTGFLTRVETRVETVPPERYAGQKEFRDLPPDAEVVELVVVITEVPARTIDFEVGFGSYDLLIGTVRYRDRNLFGSGRILEIAPTASFKGYGIDLRLIDRDLFVKWLGPDHFIEYHAAFIEHEEPTFDRTRFEVGTSLHKAWNPHLSNRMAYTFVSERADNIEAAVAEVDNNEFINNGTFSIGGRVEYRDRPQLPTRGWMGDLDLAWSTPPFGSDLDFFELDATLTTVFPIVWDNLTFVLGARYTNRDPLDNAPTLPVQYRLFNGGVSSVRSFTYNQLSPLDDEGEAIGGLSRGSATAELRLRFGDSPWSIAGFYDVGFVDEETYGIPDDFGHALGGGIRYALPVGPIRVDAAWGPGERFAAEDDWAINFAIGHIY